MGGHFTVAQKLLDKTQTFLSKSKNRHILQEHI